MIPLHYVTDLNRVNNQKKVFFEITRFFLLALTFFDLQGLAGLELNSIKENLTMITEVFPGTRKMERKEKPLKKSCQNPVEHAP